MDLLQSFLPVSAFWRHTVNVNYSVNVNIYFLSNLDYLTMKYDHVQSWTNTSSHLSHLSTVCFTLDTQRTHDMMLMPCRLWSLTLVIRLDFSRWVAWQFYMGDRPALEQSIAPDIEVLECQELFLLCLFFLSPWRQMFWQRCRSTHLVLYIKYHWTRWPSYLSCSLPHTKCVVIALIGLLDNKWVTLSMFWIFITSGKTFFDLAQK